MRNVERYTITKRAIPVLVLILMLLYAQLTSSMSNPYYFLCFPTLLSYVKLCYLLSDIRAPMISFICLIYFIWTLFYLYSSFFNCRAWDLGDLIGSRSFGSWSLVSFNVTTFWSYLTSSLPIMTL